MKHLHRYMIKSYLGPFVLTFFITIFILLMQFLWKYVDDLVGKGLEWDVIIRLLYYASATFVPLALPLAVLLSSLMTFGNLGEHYELVAIKSNGISLQKAMRPLTILAVFISLGAFLFANYVYPVANLKFGSLLYDVRQKKFAFNLDEGVFDNNLNGYVMRAGKKSKDNKTIYDVMIYDHTNNKGNDQVTIAKKGVMALTPNQQKAIFTLYDGYSYHDITTGRNHQKNLPFEYIKFKKQVLSIDLSQLAFQRTNEDLFKSNYTMLNVRQLNHAIDSLSKQLVQREKEFKKSSLRRFGPLDKMNTKSQKSKKIIPEDQTKITFPLLSNLDLSQKKKILDRAQNMTRVSNENFIFHKEKYLKPKEKLIIRHEIVWHQKFKLSLACLIFFFIGAPLGAIIRKGGLGLPVVVSVLFFVVYHVISVVGEKAARTEEMSVVLGMWLSTLIILPLGLFLTYKSTTDAPLMDTESWTRFFESNKLIRKIMGFLSIKKNFQNHKNS